MAYYIMMKHLLQDALVLEPLVNSRMSTVDYTFVSFYMVSSVLVMFRYLGIHKSCFLNILIIDLNLFSITKVTN